MESTTYKEAKQSMESSQLDQAFCLLTGLGPGSIK